MNMLSVSTYTTAIRATHGAESRLERRERVNETFKGDAVWEGEVLVFELEGHPEARWCYAWEVDGEVVCVLGVPPVESAVDAVRAAIMEEGLQ